MPKRRILILDDDPNVGQTIQWIAESLEFDAEFVTEATEFFEKLVQTCPDIITIDLIMPELDGVEIMRLLAERKCRARIIISSGMGTRVLDAAERSATEHGLNVVGILSKPITKESLRRLVGDGNGLAHSTQVEETLTLPEADGIGKAELQRALDQHQIGVVFQPKIHCRNGAAEGFEALARWNHPEKGTIMPDSFIPVAEEAGLIDVLTAQVFERSLAWFAAACVGNELKLSLNLSPKSLVDLHLADRLSALCNEYRVAPEGVVLELTESTAMVDPMLSLDLMTRFRVKGFHLSIDDFGTGYSSMLQLVRLPFSEIKIDKSFVIQAQQSRESRTVIKSVVDLGHSLGLTVTAEGVEDTETLGYLKSLGCDLAQGYFIARPMPGEAASEWFRQRMPEPDRSN